MGLSVAIGILAVVAEAPAGELNVYSHRHYDVDQKINALFTARTGIAVNVVSADGDQLIERLRAEGANSPADVLVSVDAARLQIAKAAGLLQAMNSPVVAEHVPAEFRDEEGYWTGYTVRVRVIMRSVDRVAADEIADYEDLADPGWRGRVLVRSSANSYNQSLLASIIAAKGEDAARDWAAGLVRNMARAPQGNDRDQIKAVAAGLADVCLANTYYLGLLLNSTDPQERAAAAKVAVVFPNQDGRGAHANVSAAGITRHAGNVDAARQYIEFLTSPEVQKMIAEGSYEHPINLDLSLSSLHESWGEFKVDDANLSELGKHQQTAMRLFDQVGWR